MGLHYAEETQVSRTADVSFPSLEKHEACPNDDDFPDIPRASLLFCHWAFSYTLEKSILNLANSNQIFYSNYSLPIDWTPNRIPFGAISIVRVSLQSKFGLNLKDSELISLCAISCIIWWQLFVGRLMLINRSLDNGK